MQLAAALHFYKDDYAVETPTNGVPQWKSDADTALLELPHWLGKKKCADGSAVPLLEDCLDASKLHTCTLDSCAEACEERPGCFLFEFTHKIVGTTHTKSCNWHNTPGRDRCANWDIVPQSATDFTGLFMLRAGVWLCMTLRILGG